MTFRAITAPVRSLSPRRRAGIAVAAGAGLVLPLMGMAGTANAADSSTWDKVAQCESTGNWGINTGNGFSGGLQFTPSTWAAYGGTAYASSAQQATKSQQIAVAERVLAGQGPGAWPVCSKTAGLSGGGNANATAEQSSGKTKATVEQKSAPKKSTESDAKSAPKSSTDAARKSESKAPARTEAKLAPKHGSTESAPKSSATPKSSTTKHAPASGAYTVKAGDTLSDIAAKTGVKGGWKALYAANHATLGDNPNLINVGAKLSLAG
ncbi:transglycosylase family protein [Streptomyces sp. SID3343]|uniref:transglycosylase family protein n=1 Tax=Streptomyces sp. SID3343 TaxID=2690260 RepID=UPI00136CEFCC|nr:transglycosylase family protein [Streptomyces sp. SID3343]MYW03783.1 LysM peptidoglycan-binding domain-containing protein [Streptomyces sp. SID3343]